MAPRGSSVLAPNLGLYLGFPPLTIPARGLRACRNVRLKNGKIVRDNMGWAPFPNTDSAINLDNQPVTLIDNFFTRAGSQVLVLGTTKDLFQYDEGDEAVAYITPRYETGTISVTNGSDQVEGVGTSWLANAKAGDKIFVGATGETDPAATWVTVESVEDDTHLTLTANYAGTTASTQAYTLRKLFTGDLFDWWSSETFPNAQEPVVGDPGDRWYATNGIDQIVGWDGETDQVYFPNLGNFRANILLRHKNRMLYFNINVDGERKPQSMRNSAIGAPEDIVNDEAAENQIYDGTDPILEAFPLGDVVIVYGERTIALAQAVDFPTLWVFRTAVSGVGPVGGRAIADFGDFHEFVGPDAMYRFDGITIKEINSHVWREVLRQHSPSRRTLFLAHFDEENGEVLWTAPLNTDPDPEDGPPVFAYTEHYLEEVGQKNPTPFALRDFPATATGYFERQSSLTFDNVVGNWSDQNFRWDDRFFQAAFPFNLFGDENGNIFILGEADSLNGVALESYARFGRRAGVDGNSKALIRRIYPFVEQYGGENSTLTVTLFIADQAAGPATDTGQLSYDMTQAATSNRFVNPFKAARFYEVEFRADGIGRPWTCQGYDIDAVKAGSR